MTQMIGTRAVVALTVLGGVPLLCSGCPDFPAELLLEPSSPDAAPVDVAGPGSEAGPRDLMADAWREGSVPDAEVPDVAPADVMVDAGCVADPPWSSAGHAYRQRLTVSEKLKGSLAAGYSLRLILDTKVLINDGKLLASGDDLRVFHDDGSGAPRELHRMLVDLDSASTEVWFKSPAAVAGSDRGYFVYYGDPGAGAPPAHWADSMGAGAKPSAVFLAGDDFAGHGAGDKPDGWVGSGNYRVALAGNNRLLEVNSADGPADYLFAGDLGWKDIAVSARLRVLDVDGEHYGLWVRADGTSDFRTAFWGLANKSSLQFWTARIGSAAADSLASSNQLGSWGLGGSTAAGWHRIGVRASGQTLALVFDRTVRATEQLPGTQMTLGRIGLCAGYAAGRAQWDDVIVRAYVDPEPLVIAEAEVPRCP